MEFVGVGLRAVAAFIDLVILFVIGYAIAALTGGAGPGAFGVRGAPFFIWVLVALAYYTFLEARFGYTVGKRIVGLRVVKEAGLAPLDWEAAIIRNVLRVVDGLFFYFVGALFIWTSASKQRLGDRIAHTVVVRAARVPQPS